MPTVAALSVTVAKLNQTNNDHDVDDEMSSADGQSERHKANAHTQAHLYLAAAFPAASGSPEMQMERRADRSHALRTKPPTADKQSQGSLAFEWRRMCICNTAAGERQVYLADGVYGSGGGGGESVHDDR